MGFASIDAMVKAYTAGRKQQWRFSKTGSAGNETPEAAAQWVSYYLAAGSPGAGTAPSTSWADFNNGSGSMFFTDVSPQKRYVYSISCRASVGGTLLVYDRLGHINLNANSLVSTGNKTITAVLPARYSGADTEDLANIEAWIEITEATAAGSTVVMDMNSYTNEGGTTTHDGAAVTFPAEAINIGYMTPLPLQAGDKGVQAIATVNVNTAGTTSGEFNVLLVRPIAEINVDADELTLISVRDGLSPTRIYDDSSLCFAWQATSTAVVNFWGTLTTVYDGS